jgi:hypothetical protein
MSKAKKKPARKPSTKPADGIEAKRAKAYHDMEPALRDCERWSELAEVLSLDHDRSHYDMVVRHLAEKMEKLVAAYYEMGGYEPWSAPNSPRSTYWPSCSTATTFRCLSRIRRPRLKSSSNE